jgi:hypothetical protein
MDEEIKYSVDGHVLLGWHWGDDLDLPGMLESRGILRLHNSAPERSPLDVHLVRTQNTRTTVKPTSQANRKHSNTHHFGILCETRLNAALLAQVQPNPEEAEASR